MNSFHLKVDGLAYKKVHQSASQYQSTTSSISQTQKPQSNLIISSSNTFANLNQTETIVDLKLSTSAASSQQNHAKNASISPSSKSSPSKIPQTAYKPITVCKEPILPVIAVASKQSSSSVLRNPTVRFYQSLDRQATSYIIKLASENNENKSAVKSSALTPASPVRHSFNDFRFRKKDFQTRTPLNEPKLFEFKHYEVTTPTTNRMNKPILMKRRSFSYHHLIKISRNRISSDLGRMLVLF